MSSSLGRLLRAKCKYFVLVNVLLSAAHIVIVAAEKP